MTLRTALVIDGDSDGAQAALRELDQAVERTDTSTAGLGQEAVKASVGLERLRVAKEAAAAAGVKLTQSGTKAEGATKNLGITVEMAERYMRKASIQLENMGQASNKVTTSVGAQRAGMQQLSYQVNDVATMYAMGARPMQIFASQGGQVIQAIGLMSGGAKGLAGFLGGPWGIAIGAAATALVPLVSSLLNTSGALDDVRSKAEAARDALLGLQGETTEMRIAASHGELTRLQEEEAAIRRRIDRARGIGMMGEGTARQIEREELAPKLQEILKYQQAIHNGNRDLREQAQREEELAAARAKSAGAARASAGATRGRSGALSEEAKAYNQRNLEAQRFIQTLELEIEKIGLDAQGLRELEIKRATEAAATDAQRIAIAKLSEAREQAMALQERETRLSEARKSTEVLDASIEAVRQEAQVLELVGWAREKALIQMQREAEIRPLLAEMVKAQADGEQALANEYQRQIDLLNEKYGLQSQMGEWHERLEQEREAFERMNYELRQMAGLLQQIGGFGGVLGGLIGFTSGNFDAIGGPIGALLELTIGTTVNEMGETIAVRLGDVFTQALGEFGGVLTGALQNAGIGMLGANAILGQQGTTGQIGSALGGVLGGIAGGAFQGAITGIATGAFGSTLGAAIGSAVPVIGTILGGLAGGLVGKLFGGGADWGTVSSSGFAGGNSGQLQGAAGQAIANLNDSLKSIADQLGATLGDFSTSIGLMDGKWRVSTTGRTGKLENKYGDVTNFGTEGAAEALKFALADAIRDGALVGLRAGTQALLMKEGDIEEQLAKALAFEQLFDQIESAASPLKAEIDAVNRRFSELQAILREAGATTEEFAMAAQYQQQVMQQLIAQASATYRSIFYTDAQNVDFAKQQIAATLGPMGLGHIDTVAEYMREVENTDPLAEPEKYGALMELADEFGVLKRAAEEAAAATKLEAEQKKAEAAAARSRAEANLAAAYQRESSALQGVADRLRNLGDRLREVRDDLVADEIMGGSREVRLGQLRRTGAMAGLGDEDAMGRLPDAVNSFLAASREEASSLEEARRDAALAAQYLNSAIGAADAGATMAEQQLEELKSTVGQLIDLNENVMSVKDAIDALRGMPGGAGGSGRVRERPEWVNDLINGVRDRRFGREDILERIERNTAQGAVSSNQTARRLRDWDVQGRLLTTSRVPGEDEEA